MTDREALLALNAIGGLNGQKVLKLIERIGSASSILNSSQLDLLETGVFSLKLTQKIIDFNKNEFLTFELSSLKKQSIRFVTIIDEEYPPSLLNIPDPPIALYIKGSFPLDLEPSIAIVGARHATLYGLRIAEQMALGLAECGFSIISGLAKGIDAAAHRGTIKAKGKTYAVLGNGLDHIYPAENSKLYSEICQLGSLLSEYPMQTPPLPFRFPMRNRIISGLAWGVIVVEAAARSGALITSQLALDQGKEVFAIPGAIDNPNSRGVHKLIQQGAKLVNGIKDVIEEFESKLKEIKFQDFGSSKDTQTQKICRKSLSEEELGVYNCISFSPVHADFLFSRSKVKPQAGWKILTDLEFKRFVKQLPGHYYVRDHS